MKGAQQVVTSVLLTAVLIAVVTAVTAVGLPLLEKTRDTAVVDNSRSFMINLEESIKNVANHGGRKRIPVTVDSEVFFSGEKLELSLTTSGTIFDSETEIPLGRNSCGITEGKWQDNSPLTLCVTSTCIQTSGENCREYSIIYTLEPVELKIKDTIESRKIDILSDGIELGNKDTFIVLEKVGDQTVGNVKKSIVKLSIES
jgi:hypothetical protein